MKQSPVKTPVLILGGGLAGLSASYHLKKKSIVIERDKNVGGTARSFKVGGFTFDFTGHLLHLHNPYTKKLITRLLNNQFYRCQRNTWIFSKDTYTKYPFQANTFGLPSPVVTRIVTDYLRVYLENQRNKKNFRKMNFEKWCRNVFGNGIADHFMIPYNEKLYQIKARTMNVDWCGPFVPQPKLEEVIRGALGSQDKQFGYNATFLYPKRGGIEVLPKSLSRKVKTIKTKTVIKKLYWKKKTAMLSTGETIKYNHFINSIPLPEFLKILSPLPQKIKKYKKKLKCVSILCLNIGIRRSRISDKSWIYFPEKEYPFYRVGFPMNFTPHAVPRGCSSMYVEIPMNWGKGKSKKQILTKVIRSLNKARILKKGDKIAVAQFLPIPYAYVIYDKFRQKALNRITSFLKKNKIQSIGRYGGWKYSFMEAAILDGREAARKIKT